MPSVTGANSPIQTTPLPNSNLTSTSLTGNASTASLQENMDSPTKPPHWPPLPTRTTLPHIRHLTATEDDWPEVAGNINKARRIWGTDGEGTGKGGGRPESVTDLLHRRDTAGTNLRGRDVGVDGKDGKVPGRLSGQGSAEAHRETASTQEIRGVVIPFTGRSNEGGGDRSD